MPNVVRSLGFVMLLALVGCSGEADDELRWRPEADVEVTDERHELVGRVMAQLHEDGTGTGDAIYSISPREGGYRIHFQWVWGYERSEPVFVPGGHTAVDAHKDGTIRQIYRGR